MIFLLPGARRKCRCSVSGSAAQRKLLQLFTVAILTSRCCILSNGIVCTVEGYFDFVGTI